MSSFFASIFAWLICKVSSLCWNIFYRNLNTHLILLSIPIQSPFHHCPHNHYSPSLSCSLFQFYDITMMSYVAYYSLIVLSAVAVLTLLPVNIGVAAGPLDSFSWARADKIPIDVNLPWLPCKYPLPLLLFCTRKPPKALVSSNKSPQQHRNIFNCRSLTSDLEWTGKSGPQSTTTTNLQMMTWNNIHPH